MAPNADSESARLETLPIQSRRIQPDGRPPAQAWTENEDPNSSPGENRRLLPVLQNQIESKSKPKSCLQTGLTSGVRSKYPSPKKSFIQKYKYQKIKDKLIAVLKPPYFIVTIIFVIVCVQLVCTCELKEKLEFNPRTWFREPWRLLTYGFLHATRTHLATNAIVALAIGWLLEREQSWWRVLIVWFAGVVAGALGVVVLQRVRMVGSSAAVFAILTAHLANVCLRYGHIPLWWFRPLSVAVLEISEGCWTMSSATSGAATTHAHPPLDEVAWAAHLMGAAIGIPVAFLVFTGENEGKRYILVCRIISVLTLLTGVILAAIYCAYWGDDLIDLKNKVSECEN